MSEPDSFTQVWGDPSERRLLSCTGCGQQTSMPPDEESGEVHCVRCLLIAAEEERRR